MTYQQAQKQYGWSEKSACGPLRRKDKCGKHDQTLLAAAAIAAVAERGRM